MISQTKLIYEKMSLVMADISSVSKNAANTGLGYKFRSIDNLINALYPALVKHGVFMVPECVSETHDIREVTRKNGNIGIDKHVNLQVKYHFYAVDGSSVTVGPIPSEGLDTGDKATNKAMSAALKYALIQTFCIPTEDMEDADATTPEIAGTVVNTTPEVSGTTLTPANVSKTTFRKPSKRATPPVVTDVEEELSFA